MNFDIADLKRQLTECYHQHKYALLSSAAAYASPSCSGEDILQEALCNAVRRIQDFPSKGCEWIAWLKGLIRTAGLDTLRKHKRKRERVVLANDLRHPDDSNESELVEKTPEDGPLPDDLVCRKEDAHFLAQAMHILQQKYPKEHEIIDLLFSPEEPSAVELATQLGLTADNIRQIHGRAVKHLRAIINELTNE